MTDNRVPLEQHELAELIRQSASHGPVAMSLGSDGNVWLDPKRCLWAVPVLERLRGESFSDGAGI